MTPENDPSTTPQDPTTETPESQTPEEQSSPIIEKDGEIFVQTGEEPESPESPPAEGQGDKDKPKAPQPRRI